MCIPLLLLQSLTRRPICPLSTFALVQPTAAFSMSSTKTNPKRPLPDDIAPEAKRQHIEEDVPEPGGEEDWFKGMIYPRVSKVENAEKMDGNPPLKVLEGLLAEQRAKGGQGGKGRSVVYWLNLEDLRLEDNRALSKASALAQKQNVPLVVVTAINPGDYKAHDRSHRRIDFYLRNLVSLKAQLEKLHIPLLVLQNDGPRKALPSKILDLVTSRPLQVANVFANLSYEVDELQRNIALLEQGKEKGVTVEFLHDRLVVPPGGIERKSKDGGVYTVYSPWFKTWGEKVNANLSLLDELPLPAANLSEAYESLVGDERLRSLLEIPKEVKGFGLDEEDRKQMEKLYPVGHQAALEILERFVTTKERSSQIGDSSPLAPDAEPASSSSSSLSRLDGYADGRNRADRDTSSRLSPYLASGVLSPRQVLNRARKHKGGKGLPLERKDGVGMWVGEVAWRDFYNHILAAFPRLSMGQPFNQKYRGVQWETDPATFQAWKDGKTGFPIVDAAMRQARTQGWMHNRARMIAASFLVKDLMLDWRLGERYFMSVFIDGDLAANNGGWQWTASTGCDPSPYFRIFSPISQSAKADPTGDYIRFFVPELRGLKGKALYEPHSVLSPAEFKKVGYPAPMVDHAKARLRALDRFKNVGEKPDEADGKMDVTTPRKGKAPKKAEGQDLSKFGFKAEPASSSSPPSKRAAKVPPNFDHPKRGSK